MNTVAVNYENIEIPLADEKIIKFCLNILKSLEISNWEISVLICDNTLIKELNNKFRNIDESTDVLSFNQELIPLGNTIYAGDIVISQETVKQHADTFNVTIDEELKRVLIHGILHLKGMDHETNSTDEKMLVFQEKILSDLSGDRII